MYSWPPCLAPGNSTVCSVTISGVHEADHGEWTCALSDNLSLDTVKERVQLGVVMGGEVSLSPGAGVIQLGEGDTGQLVCRVEAAWPRPTIAWSLETLTSEGERGELDTSREVRTEMERCIFQLNRGNNNTSKLFCQL